MFNADTYIFMFHFNRFRSRTSRRTTTWELFENGTASRKRSTRQTRSLPTLRPLIEILGSIPRVILSSPPISRTEQYSSISTLATSTMEKQYRLGIQKSTASKRRGRGDEIKNLKHAKKGHSYVLCTVFRLSISVKICRKKNHFQFDSYQKFLAWFQVILLEKQSSVLKNKTFSLLEKHSCQTLVPKWRPNITNNEWWEKEH